MGSPRRLDVEVLAKHSLDASITPIAVKLEDGRRLMIDRIVDTCQAASRKAGGKGIRYACYINGKQIMLFHDSTGVWFCEV